MERYPIPTKLATEIHFTTLKMAFEIEKKNIKSRKSDTFLKRLEKSQNLSLWELVLGALQGMIIGLKLFRKMLNFERYF